MRGQAFYKALLRCYPAAFRDEYGNQMFLMFTEQLGEARRAGSPLEAAALWGHAAWDALTVAPKEHWNVIFQDIRLALRSMAARPGFAGIAILSLALGIGANTAIFSLWNGLLHSSLPLVRQPEQLVLLSDPNAAGLWHGDSRGERDLLTYGEFGQLRDQAASFSAVMASESMLERWPIRFRGSDFEEASGRLVSGGYFHLLGISPVIGRVFTESDDREDSPYAVISYGYWQRRFAGNANVLGRTFALRNVVLTIIGVTPRGFIGETAGQEPDLWMSVRMEPALVPGDDRLHDTPPSKAMWLHVFGRLKPGVTPARAESESNAIFKAGLESFYSGVASPDRRRELLDQHLKIRPGASGASDTRGDYSTSLTVLLAAVGVLLLIACANVANLLLARGAVRRPEMALRLSLGASRGRLIRQLVTESLVLAAAGMLCGLVAAWLVFGALVRMIAQGDQEFQMKFTLDPMALAFTLGVTVAAALLFGLLPAWQATRTDAGVVLKEQGRAGGSLGRTRWGRSLVTLQLALSLPLLVCAGLLARTVYNLQHVDLGYPAEHLLMVGINSRLAGYNSARSATLFRDLQDRIQRIPGVKAATFSHNGLFTGSNSGDEVQVEGFTPKKDDDKDTPWDMVGPRYFSTLGIPLLLGRDILESDDAGAPKVCAINEAFAKKFFAERNPLGLHVTLIDDTPSGPKGTTYQVVGVARSVRTNALRGEVKPRLYIPFAQPHGDNVKRANFLIRAPTDSTPVLRAVRQTVQKVDAGLPVLYPRTMEEQLAPWTAPNRATAQVAVVFGCIALALAAIGLYGVLSYNIARRKGEIAIRIALGAQPGRVIQMILRETSALVVAGLIVGAGLTYAAARWIASQLYGISPQDPITMTLAAALLLIVALSAVYLPARRASRTDPMAALRQE
jgi:putative ABC transport system permease protein